MSYESGPDVDGTLWEEKNEVQGGCREKAMPQQFAGQKGWVVDARVIFVGYPCGFLQTINKYIETDIKLIH